MRETETEVWYCNRKQVGEWSYPYGMRNWALSVQLWEASDEDGNGLKIEGSRIYLKSNPAAQVVYDQNMPLKLAEAICRAHNGRPAEDATLEQMQIWHDGDSVEFIEKARRKGLIG